MNAASAGLEAAPPQDHDLRQLRGPHRARAGAPGADQLDRRRGGLRRAHVPPLLPHDQRRPRADGQRLGPDRFRRAGRPAVHARRARPPSAQPRACAGSCPISPRRRSRTPGAARSTSRRTTCRSSAPFPATRIHYGAGYSGHGAGPTWLGGQILSRLVLGDRRRADPAAARDPPGPEAPARADPPARRRARARLDPRLRGGRGGRPPRARSRPARALLSRACWACASGRAERKSLVRGMTARRGLPIGGVATYTQQR